MRFGASVAWRARWCRRCAGSRKASIIGPKWLQVAIGAMKARSSMAAIEQLMATIVARYRDAINGRRSVAAGA